jgi:hypothetical protein
LSLQTLLSSDDLPTRVEMSGNPIRCNSRFGGALSALGSQMMRFSWNRSTRWNHLPQSNEGD